jgi:hypothetical protein
MIYTSSLHSGGAVIQSSFKYDLELLAEVKKPPGRNRKAAPKQLPE